jgi:hypothetical protein
VDEIIAFPFISSSFQASWSPPATVGTPIRPDQLADMTRRRKPFFLMARLVLNGVRNENAAKNEQNCCSTRANHPGQFVGSFVRTAFAAR